ncbi:uncharacterized protein LOC144424603 isoform X2 [Styela clava]
MRSATNLRKRAGIECSHGKYKSQTLIEKNLNQQLLHYCTFQCHRNKLIEGRLLKPCMKYSSRDDRDSWIPMLVGVVEERSRANFSMCCSIIAGISRRSVFRIVLSSMETKLDILCSVKLDAEEVHAA